MFVRKASFSKLLLTCFAVVFAVTVANDVEAQLFSAGKSEHGSSTVIQYAPDSPHTRSRLFNLQTGHAGAFYNCDGEEDKRNSPHICWKTGHGDRLHNTFRDVLNWKKDKSEIAQRICDGAGACCSGIQGCSSCQQQQAAHVVQPQASCGCVNCAIAKSDAVMPAKRMHRSLVSAPAKARSGLLTQPRTNMARVATTNQAVGSFVETRGIVEVAACDCSACRTKRRGDTVKTQPVTTMKTASLLDRARSSRNR